MLLYLLLTLVGAVLIAMPMVSIGAMHAIPFSFCFASWMATMLSFPNRKGSMAQALSGLIVSVVGLVWMMLNNPCQTALIATPIFTGLQGIWALFARNQFVKGKRD